MAESPLLSDYLALEPLLLAQLKKILPEGWGAGYLFDLTDVRERQARAPAVFVGFAGDGVESSAGDGSTNRVFQEFWVIVAATTARQTEAARDLRAKVGKILARLLNSADGLAGWTPERKTWQPLEYRPGNTARYTAGYVEYPTLWRTRLTVKTTHHRNR